MRYEIEENGRLVSFIFRESEIVIEESQEDKIRYIRTNTLIASDAESARMYYHYASDEMSSTTHVVDSETGEILNQYEYDVWGNPTVCEEKVSNRFKFNGQQYDLITQQYYLRARYYNPVIGRFTQEDTYRGDGLNLYAYCANNPVYYIDPSGHTICPGDADRISNLIDEGRIKGKNRSKLEEYLKQQQRNGEIKAWEQNIANKLGIGTNRSSNFYKYLEQLSNLPEGKINHFINGSKNSNHRWELLVPDKNWNKIKYIIADVMDIGTITPYKSVWSKVATVKGHLVKVTYNQLGNVTIYMSDAWIIY